MRLFAIVMMSLAMTLGLRSCHAAPLQNPSSVVIQLAGTAVSAFEKCSRDGPCYPRPPVWRLGWSELTPSEYFNGELKGEIQRGVPPKDVRDLKRTMLSNSRRIQKSPARVRAYFKHRNIRYAA